jgi:general secretion pathway protein B
MSFILDALKKSENDRQRQSGPALFEVKVPPPRSRFPLLATSIIALLVVNLGVVAWLMFRKPADAAVPQAQPAVTLPPQAAPQQAQTAPPPVYPPAPGQPPPAQAGYPPAGGYYGQPQGAPPPGYGQQNAPPNAAYGQGQPPNSAYPNGSYPNGGYPNNAYPGQGQQQAYGNAGGYPPSAPAGEPQLSEDPEAGSTNPDDYAPARQPNPGLFGLGRATRSTESGYPTYEEAASRVSLPQLHLDLHSYAPNPAQRFILVNMRRLYEGQATPEGVKVESITTDAAILSFQGTKFVLNRE